MNKKYILPIVILAGAGILYFYFKNKSSVICNDGTKGNNTNRPCAEHGGIASASNQVVNQNTTTSGIASSKINRMLSKF